MKKKMLSAQCRIASFFVCLFFYGVYDEGHEHKVAALGRIGDGVFFAVRTEGGLAGVQSDFSAVIVVEGFTLQDVIGFTVAMMRMQADGAAGADGDFGKHIAAFAELRGA